MIRFAHIDLVEPRAPDAFDLWIERVLIALLVFTPLALGAVEPWSETIVVGLAGAAAALLAVKLLIRRDARFAWSWIFLPVALFAGFVAIQLVPLPAGVVKALSPETAAMRARLLGDVSNSGRVLGAMTLSFYPPATREALRMLLAAGVVLVVVVNVFRRPEAIKRLLGTVAAIGCAAGILALAQDLTSSNAIFWFIPLTSGTKASGGPFVNHNNFAQFMNLSLGCAIALLLVKVQEASSSRRRSVGQILDRLARPEYRAVRLLAIAIVIGAMSVLLSGSRGGIISLAVAFVVTTALVTSHRRVRGAGALLLVIGLMIFAALVYAGSDAALERLSTLRNVAQAAGDRWQMNKDVLAMLPRFRLTGIGLEAHEWVYPQYSTLTNSTVSGSVENEYLQLAEETGLIGVAMFAAFIGMLVYVAARVIRRGALPVHAAVFGIAFGLIAAAVHSNSDFGQRVPAAACLSAVCCGLLINLGRIGIDDERGFGTSVASSGARISTMSPLRAKLIPAAAVIACVIIGGWALIGASNVVLAENQWDQAIVYADKLAQQNWQGSNEDYIALLKLAGAAVDRSPEDVHYRYKLNQYRWNSLTRLVDEKTGRMIVTPRTRGFVERIVDDLHATRTLCPTYGAPYVLAGQLEMFMLDRTVGADHVRLGAKLAATDPDAQFAAGHVNAMQGRWEEALAALRRSVVLGRSQRDAVDLLAARVKRPDMALALVKDDVDGLMRLNELLEKSGEDAALLNATRVQIVARVKHDAAQPDPTPTALAAMARLLASEKNYSGAADYYTRALARDYGNVDWRFGLAQALAQAGQVPEAMREARVCLRLRPEMTEAQKLIGELSVRPTSEGGGGGESPAPATN